MHELPLVFFTVLAQTAVGGFIFLMCAKALGQVNSRQLAVGLFSAMCLFGLALIIASLHMGQPLRAINMLFGVGRSAMSNEIAFSALFAAFGGIAALGLLLNKGGYKLFMLLAVAAAIIGGGVLVLIPLVYQLNTVAIWDNSYTVFNMILTAFIVGGAIAIVFGAVRLGSIISMLAIVTSLISKIGYLPTIYSANPSLAMAQTPWFIAQGILLVLGLAMLIGSKCYNCTGKIVAVVTVLVLISAEILGRIAFYNLWAIVL